MAKTAGRFQTLEIDSGSGFTIVNGVIDATFAGETEELDTTAHDDVNSRTFITGRFTGTIDGSLRWNQDDLGQQKLADAFFGKTTISVRYRQETAVGRKQYTAAAIITSWQPSGPNDDVAELAFTLRLSGDVTVANQ